MQPASIRYPDPFKVPVAAGRRSFYKNSGIFRWGHRIARWPTGVLSRNVGSAEFDPYDAWLAIGPDEQPPSHYRLLGLRPYEDDPQLIQHAGVHRHRHVCAHTAAALHGDETAGRSGHGNGIAQGRQRRAGEREERHEVGPSRRRPVDRSIIFPALAVGFQEVVDRADFLGVGSAGRGVGGNVIE